MANIANTIHRTNKADGLSMVRLLKKIEPTLLVQSNEFNILKLCKILWKKCNNELISEKNNAQLMHCALDLSFVPHIL